MAEKPIFKQDSECQKAFDMIKEYLARMLTLKQPTENKPLIVYLAVGEKAVSSLLIQEDDGRQQ